MSTISIKIADKTWLARAGERHHAIANFHLQVENHQFVCLLGPSGCGKTTLLNMIAGLDTQFRGEISITTTNTMPPKLGYVFQNPRLLPWLTVRQNIEVVFLETAASRLIDELLMAMQLGDKQHAYPQHLSLGMQRRVAIIRAFAVNPDLLLMDEPFVSLDAANGRQIRDSLYRLWLQRPHTVLFVTHDLREAIALADRLIFLSPPPMRNLGDVIVDIPRDKRGDEKEIEHFRSSLLAKMPSIATML